MYKYFLGIRYLLGRPINLLGTVGVMVAVWALVVIISVFSGFITQVRAHIRSGAPALTLLDNSLETSYEDVEGLLLDDPDVAAVAPRIKWHGLLYPASSRATRQFMNTTQRDTRLTPFYQIIGIDYEKETALSNLRQWLDNVHSSRRRVDDLDAPFRVPKQRVPESLRGDFDQTIPGILIGQWRTGIRSQGYPIPSGEPVVVVSAKKLPDGGTKGVKRQLLLAGAYSAPEAHELEDTQAFVDIEWLRSVFGHDADDPESLDVFTEISIALKDESKSADVAARLNAKLRDKSINGAVVSWEDRKATYLTAVEIERGVMKVVLFVFMVVASFLIFATISMMVTKKTRDIGIISALGGTRSGVLVIFLISGVVIALIGTLLGIGTGLLTCHYLNDVNDFLDRTFDFSLFPKAIYALQEIPIELDSTWIVQVAGIAIANAFVFSLFPAWRASRFDPVRALRYE